MQINELRVRRIKDENADIKIIVIFILEILRNIDAYKKPGLKMFINNKYTLLRNT